MTPEEFAKLLQDAYPKAVDIPQSVYDRDCSTLEQVASRIGYLFAGYRLNRAVFSTKKRK